MRKCFLYTVAFLTGFALMGYEILGVRAVTPYFGGSVYVWGAIIAVVLAGLSLGYAWGGRLAERMTLEPVAKLPVAARHALPTRFARSLAIGSLDKTILFKLIIASAALISLFPLYGYGIAGFVYRLGLDARVGALVAGLVLFTIPCVFMGAVVPILVKLLVVDGTPAGAATGNVCAASTIGSIGGTLFTSFFLIGWVGVATGMVLLGLLQACGLFLCISRK